MRRRAWRNSRPRARAMSRPSKRISPSVQSMSLFTQRSSVDFPAPELPMTATSSPGATFRLTSESARPRPS